MSVAERSTTLERRRIKVGGVVQGVGFRPFVHRLATRFGLGGFVQNGPGGVTIEVEGDPGCLDDFAAALLAERPPLAHIAELSVSAQGVGGDGEFSIVASAPKGTDAILIPPDVALCADCGRESLDPDDRRYRYPFTNCTNCGPRFSIIERVPYDRPHTTMASFTMCDTCRNEYGDPSSRRFHAQPNACPLCGPQLAIVEGASAAPCLTGDAAIRWVATALRNGSIVAIKGIGGFHLAADATDSAAVARLRQRKGREAKPFAVMARDLAAVRTFARVTEAEAAELTSVQRPIVLLEKNTAFDLAPAVAPENRCVGVMVPYTPLHQLLFSDDDPGAASADRGPILVMTSANRSGEPIVIDNGCAHRQLHTIVDAFLQHDRDIHMRCDDSVVRVIGDRATPIRRSRGYAPMPVTLPWPVGPTLGVGGELKSTFCLAAGRHAFMSQHIGDMANLETLEAFESSVTHYTDILGLEPEVVVCDAHPAYLSRRWAERRYPGRVRYVQHHHAHVAAAMVEAGRSGTRPVLGFAFDGTGYGTDGAIWGGEILIADYAGFRRAAHLEYTPLPGGDASIQRPYRYALSLLRHAELEWSDQLPAVSACPAAERRLLRQQLETGVATVPTSSMGRLFDGVASLAGIRHTAFDEGQAAIALEALAEDELPDDGRYAFAIRESAAEEPWQIDARPIVRAVVADVRTKTDPREIATTFHGAVATMMVEVAERARQRYGIDEVVLSGGVFQNGILTAAALHRLAARGFDVVSHRLVPPNDGGIALGQVAVAHHSTLQ